MNLEKLTSAPWMRTMLVIHPEVRAKNGPEKVVEVVDAEFKPGDDFRVIMENCRHIICRLEGTRGKYEIEEANAEFIVLARNAFDVMMRRGWWVQTDKSNRWTVWSQSDDGCFVGPRQKKAGELAWAMDPFTALVEADKWYRENVEKAS